MPDGYTGNSVGTQPAAAGFDQTIASFANAALVDGGWKLALRDIARLFSHRRRACLLMADSDAAHFEFFRIELSETGRQVEFESGVLEKARTWNLAFQRHPVPQTSLVSRSADDAAATGPLLTQFMKRPADDAVIATINLGGVEGLLSVFDEDGSGGFTDADLVMLSRLHHAIERAALAHSTLGAIRTRLAVSDHLADQLPFGVITLDKDRCILSHNSSGKRLLGERSVLLERNGRLYCTDSIENQALQAALSASLADPSGPPSDRVLKFYGMDEAKPWSLSVSVLSGAQFDRSLAWGNDRPRFVLCISDRDPITNLRSRQIAHAYGLSPQEEMLAGRIASGDTLARIAQDTGRSIETLRTQLRAVFQKTEANSQAELVQLVLCAPVGVLAADDAVSSQPVSRRKA